MFNIFHYKLKKAFYFSFIFFVSISCKKNVSVTFSEEIITSEETAIVEIVYPEAAGSKTIAETINTVIISHVVTGLQIGDEGDNTISIKKAVENFDTNYKKFIKQFPEESSQWEALIEGEVIYESPEIICIAMNTYLDTGGAHGNATITFLNFDPETGRQLSSEAIIKDVNGFSELVRNHFKSNVEADSDASMKDFFYGDDFKLPSSIGFSEEGVIILYNTYEVASYSQSITEFTIPFEETSSFLKLN